jgi:hypothetical protein
LFQVGFIEGLRFIPPVYINRAHPLLKRESKRKSIDAKEKLSTRD